MNIETVINVVAIVVFLGGPLVPLLYLVTEIDHWHASVRDPEPDQAAEHH
jgi:hypothetical protein